ncbi:MAG: hypothetical protein HGGPFJEG_01896 [Ignavibacteria bacterium]|nr:hypothetical protein [Ignavibacteria bacterium]
MKNILICVSGLSPQIITETLFALSVKNKITIDEIIIVTTKVGKDLILGKIPYSVNNKKVYIKLSDKIKELCKLFKLKEINLSAKNVIEATEENISLYDIRTDEHNILFPNRICEVIRENSEDNNTTLHCSISGGRKTMSVFMGYALSLFGRNQDKLYHVLTKEENEKNRLYFFPSKANKKSEIELSNIPFVRLRGILKDKSQFLKSNFSEIVRITQNELSKFSSGKLYIDVNRREIWFGLNAKLNIEPKQIEFYKYLVDNKFNYQNPVQYSALVKYFSIDKRTGESLKGYDAENIRQLVSKLNRNKIIPAVNDVEYNQLFIIHSGQYGKSEIYLNASKENVEFIE